MSGVDDVLSGATRNGIGFNNIYNNDDFRHRQRNKIQTCFEHKIISEDKGKMRHDQDILFQQPNENLAEFIEEKFEQKCHGTTNNVPVRPKSSIEEEIESEANVCHQLEFQEHNSKIILWS